MVFAIFDSTACQTTIPNAHITKKNQIAKSALLIDFACMDITNKNPIAKSALPISIVTMKKNYTTANFVLVRGFASTGSAALTAYHAEVRISASIANSVTFASHAVAAKSVSTKSNAENV